MVHKYYKPANFKNIMKILFISEYFPPKIMGGGEINLSLLAKSLAKSGVNVSILTSHHQGLKRFEEQEGVKIYRLLNTGDNPEGILNNFKRSYSYPRSIIKQVKRISQKKTFDAIHLTGSSIISAKKLKILKIPLFATIESYPSLCPKGDRIYHNKTECKQKCTFPKFIFCQLRSTEIGKMKNRWFLKYNPTLSPALKTDQKKSKRKKSSCILVH